MNLMLRQFVIIWLGFWLQDFGFGAARAPKQMVYLNVTVKHYPDHRQRLTYELLPVPESTKREVVAAAQQASSAGASASPSNDQQSTANSNNNNNNDGFTLDNFLQFLPTIPQRGASFVGTIFGEVNEMLGINYTEVRSRPLGSAIQAINNVAFCNPIFAGFNPGRCQGFLLST